MRTKIRPIWLTLLFMAMLTLAACVRPIPQDSPSPVPTQDPLATQPFIQPVTPVVTPLSTALVVSTLEPQPTIEIVSTQEMPSETIHIVQAGDTLFKIASQYGVTIEVITSVNNVPNINQLEIGQQLIIPGPDYVAPTPTTISAEVTPLPGEVPTDTVQSADGTHIVQPGENLYRIGLQYGCTTQQMADHNGIANPNAISVGQVLEIPDCN